MANYPASDVTYDQGEKDKKWIDGGHPSLFTRNISGNKAGKNMYQGDIHFITYTFWISVKKEKLSSGY